MFFITVLLAIMGLVGTDIFVPSLPSIAIAFHQSPNHTQLTITLFLLGFALSQLFYGPISDRVGRKPPIIVGTSIFILGSLVCLSAHSFLWLCIGRIIQGVGVGGGLSLARVIMRDRYHGALLGIRSSQIAMFVSLTPAVAPFLGGILQQYFNFHASFVFMFVYGLILLILLILFFEESIQEKDHSLTFKSTLNYYKLILKNKFFMPYVFIAGLSFASIILCASVTPFIIQNQLGLSPMLNGEIILVAALGVSAGALLSSRLLRYLTSNHLVLVGLFILILSGFLLLATALLFGTHLAFLMPLIFFVTVACGLLFPNALTIAFSHIQIKIGIAGAIYGSVQIFISMLVNLLLNVIPHQGQSLLGLFYLLIGFAGLGLFLYTRRG